MIWPRRLLMRPVRRRPGKLRQPHNGDPGEPDAKAGRQAYVSSTRAWSRPMMAALPPPATTPAAVLFPVPLLPPTTMTSRSWNLPVMCSSPPEKGPGLSWCNFWVTRPTKANLSPWAVNPISLPWRTARAVGRGRHRPADHRQPRHAPVPRGVELVAPQPEDGHLAVGHRRHRGGADEGDEAVGAPRMSSAVMKTLGLAGRSRVRRRVTRSR